MANLMDQYEAAVSRPPQNFPGTQPSRVKQVPLVAAGYVTATLEDEEPMFAKQKINFRPSQPITHLVVCDNFLCLVMKGTTLLRIELQNNTDKPDEMELPKGMEGDYLYNMHLDPTGRHLIISMMSSDNFYLARGSRKCKLLSKLKGYQISSVAWNRERVSEVSTGELLLGTSRGYILETEIQNHEEGRFFQASLDQYVVKHVSLSSDASVPVTGLELESMPSTSNTGKRYFIMATLPRRMYEFLGVVPLGSEGPIFSYIFANYPDVQERFLELPGSLPYSKLQFFYLKKNAPPSRFAWMTEPGVYTADISVTVEDAVDSVVVIPHLISYPVQPRQTSPLAMVLTQFHILLLFPQWLKVVCILNEKLVHQEYLNEETYGSSVGLTKDPTKGIVWIFTTQAVFKLKITKETRDIWQIYLDQGNYNQAKTFCRGNVVQLDQVLTKEAEDLFEQKMFVKSAHCYARTRCPFEQVALKFIKMEEALRAFLTEKLTTLHSQDKAQLTLLSSWLVELYLSELGELADHNTDMSKTKYVQLREQLHRLLNDPKLKPCLTENKSLFYELIDTHGDRENMVFFAYLLNDYERVITYHIQIDNYHEALKVLQKQSQVELFYKFSPVLMQHIPTETVKAWMERKSSLSPRKLIPALVQYDGSQSATASNEAIRYLEFCLTELKVEDEAIHNYLLSLYARLQPHKIMSYLNSQGTDPTAVNYDLKYALRVCAEHEHKVACVFIYSIMELYEEAVELAIQFDLDLAKRNANKPPDDELKKKLWLKIARYVVKKDGNIKKAMEFLQSCNNMLKIEDILPFFDDFVTIDHFKDAICQSLEEYTKHINTLKEEMDEATHNAKEIRAETAAFKNKFAVIGVHEKCSSCGFPLMNKTFYIFPCQHKFHSDCLLSEVLPHLPPSSRKKVDELQKKLAAQGTTTGQPTLAKSLHDANPITVARQLSQHDVREELDELVATDCVYCGDFTIRCIDKPFLDNANIASPIHDWW